MKLLSFATGNLYRFMHELNVVEFIDSLGIKGIEYTYGKTYGERPITNKDTKILLKKNVSLHSPFKLWKFSDRVEKDSMELELMIKDYYAIRAKRFILHPEQYPGEEKINYLIKKGINVLFENERKRHGNEKKKNHSRTAFEDILQTNKKINLCLDVSHSYSWSPKETSRIIDTWQDKIQQVHFSATHYSVSHLPVRGASKAFLASVKKVKDLNVPIVIEEDMKTRDKDWILKEINEVKKITKIE